MLHVSYRWDIGLQASGKRSLSFDKIHCIFQEEDNVLADGQPFLCGNQFTAADLTFAALAGFIKSQ